MEGKKKLWDQELYEVLCQNDVNIGHIQMMEWVRKSGYTRSRLDQSYRSPTKKAMDMGLFYLEDSQINMPSGEARTITNVYLTEKGQAYFLKKFKKLCEKG